MRTTPLLAASLAAMACCSLLVQAEAHSTPKPHMMRRVMIQRNGAVYPRAPRPQGGLGGGLLGGGSSDDDDEGSSSTGGSTGGSSDSESGSGSGSDSTEEGSSGGQSTGGSGSGGSDSSSGGRTSTGGGGGGGSQSTSTSSTPAASTSTSEPSRPTSTSTVTDASSTAPNTEPTSLVQVTSTVEAPGATSTDTAATSAATDPAANASTEEDEGDSNHTGLIVGVSVVGGVAVLGALIFLYMKFGGRRFSDFQDDDADIKWPELKHDDNAAAMQPLPARRTGGAGFDMGDDSNDGHGADDTHSMQDYGAKARDGMANSSTALNSGVSMGHGTYSEYGDAGMAGYGSAAKGGSGGGAYYDQYGAYSTGHEQPYYGESLQPHYTGGPPSYGMSAGYPESQYDDGGYASHSTHTSPAVQPYRVAGNGAQGTHF